MLWYKVGLLGIAWAQIAGGWSYDFLHIAPTARSAALAGIAFPGDSDPASATQNPALLRPTAHRFFHLTLQPYLADILHSVLTYTYDRPTLGTFWAGLQYMGYGEFRRTDEVGNSYGTFSAYEGALMGGIVRHFGKWHAGMNLKLPFSLLGVESYHRFGIATDIGILYEDTSKGIAATFLLRSAGTELYRTRARSFSQPFPTTLQTTFSYRVPHAPFRVHIGIIHLERWRMAFNDPLQPVRYDLSGNLLAPPPPKWTEHLFRHFIVGVEMLPEKLITLRTAYHVQRRRELNPKGTTSFGGMSFGIGIKGGQWRLDYAYSLFFTRAGAHTISLAVRPFRAS
ncbi:MAG: type IX secretion system protein PorQ [Bacteroidia bacterium]|nr:type IX secretion system protein PorQ [Bacteroidia bacterium]MDW8236214.1 type IX secretion system protein PorQ [Bacteroidia bacterium]